MEFPVSDRPERESGISRPMARRRSVRTDRTAAEPGYLSPLWGLAAPVPANEWPKRRGRPVHVTLWSLMGKEIMKTIVDGHTEKFCKCGICGETLRTLESAILIMSGGKQSKAYCDHHRMDDILEIHPDVDLDQSQADEESRLRQMEDFAAYRAAGVPLDVYYADRDAGFCN